MAVLGGYSSITDRSVKGNNLTQTGTIVAAAVATDAELSGYSNFSASNYLSRAYDADFDFGTGDFSIMFWFKTSDVSDVENYVARMDSSLNAGDWTVLKSATVMQFYRYGSSWVKQVGTATGSVGANAWTQCVVLRRGTKYEIYLNGKLSDDGSPQSNNDTLDNSGVLSIGHALGNAGPADTSSLSLVRISATAPTPQQVKDIYEAEAPLFRAGSKCLLQGNSNAVNALGYDTSTNLLHAGTTAATGEEGVTVFNGLEAVDTFNGQDVVGVYNNPNNLSGWTANTIKKLSVAGGVSAYGRTDGSVGGVITDLPPFDVRGDTNIADSKSSNDGKIRFTGVTTDATPTVLGHIPIGENESLNIKARFTGYTYNLPSSSKHIVGEIKQQLYRNLGSVVSEASEQSKLIEEGNALLDIDLGVVAASQTGTVKVTGYAGIRMVWSVDVEVQRISEKQYER